MKLKCKYEERWSWDSSLLRSEQFKWKEGFIIDFVTMGAEVYAVILSDGKLVKRAIEELAEVEN